jgi:lipoyl(octanoyl) transferase
MLDLLAVEWRGRERYSATWQYQLVLHQRRRAGETGDTLILVEHEPVVTLGRHGESRHLLVSEQELATRGVDLHRVERGGDVTFHGPGQLVGYPIIDLRSRGLTVRELMRGLEEALMRTVAEYGLQAERKPGLTGVWVGAAKVAALGVAVKGGVSYHGFALNVHTDLSAFALIVPCGIRGKEVASIAALTGREVPLDEVRPLAVRHLVEVLNYSGSRQT